MFAYSLAVGMEALLTVVAIACLYEGSRLITVKGIHRKAAVLTAVGAIACASWAAVNFVKYRVVSNAVAAVEMSTLPKDIPPPPEWSKSLTASDRENVGRAIAREEYSQSGKLATYADRAQQTVTFIPTQDEVRDREAKVAGIAELRQLEGARYSDTLRWLLIAVLTPLLGIQGGRRSANGL